jgi:hypothetical protein
MVGSEGLGHAHSEAQEHEQGARRVARKLAVILHRMWIDGTEFCWSKEGSAMQPT